MIYEFMKPKLHFCLITLFHFWLKDIMLFSNVLAVVVYTFKQKRFKVEIMFTTVFHFIATHRGVLSSFLIAFYLFFAKDRSHPNTVPKL